MQPLEQITIEALIERHDVLLFDAYGVLVHSGGALPGAAAALDLLHRAGRAFFVVTNDASKLPETAAARYRRFGLALGPEHIVSSGQLLTGHFAAHGLVGAHCAVLGTADSAHYVRRAGGEVVPPDQPFDVLVIGDETGYDFVDGVDAALTTLFHRLDAGERVYLVLPNPDLVYPRGTRSFGIASGSVALMLEAALARRYGAARAPVFTRLGKPEPHLYREALSRVSARAPVMIGDQMETDILGAIAAGIDSVLVSTGISVDQTARADGLRPTWWMQSVAPGGFEGNDMDDAAPVCRDGISK
ncbi:MAG: HAD hydrolase-like protein [Burkholderiales bacterium]|nr:HAD hydrolase-like protein [Burkholderiales bacterium]